MASPMIYLPNGQTISVSPVFGGYFFKPNDLNTHRAVLPPGWTIQIHTEDEEVPKHDLPQNYADGQASIASAEVASSEPPPMASKKRHGHRFKDATLTRDSVFISSISNPSSTEFKPATSATRLIAMMLWTTLHWYFHHPPPSKLLTTAESANTPDGGKPCGDWRILIEGEGVFRGKNLLQKLERMGLIASEDSSVGFELDDNGTDSSGWSSMFISRRSFWQLDPRIFLFTLSPAIASPYASGSPYPSRPSSPSHTPTTVSSQSHTVNLRSDTSQGQAITLASSQGLWAPAVIGPFSSASHLPTYFPPPPLQYTFTNSIRHPIRPKPPRQGETFYTRYVPSLQQYLSFRVASLSVRPPTYFGPTTSPSLGVSPRISTLSITSQQHILGPQGPNDIQLLNRWMNLPRVAAFWGETGPISHQHAFLTRALSSRHSFPVIGCWDGKPFGYFEIYWVKEDHLGRHITDVGEWERGIHVLVGEQDYRGKGRVKGWLGGLVHWCLLADQRTERVTAEPRVDNARFISYLMAEGFAKEKEVQFPHKQAALMRLRREVWEAPSL